MLDMLGKLLIEFRDDPSVDAIAHGRVRSFEPAPGDSRPAGQYLAFVVISALVTPRHPQVPIQRPRYVVRCYGRNQQEAMALYGACSDAIHGIGPRLYPSGHGIYVSHDETGGTQDKDPTTQQPLVSFVVELVATITPVVA
jgi:hypothetical protein